MPPDAQEGGRIRTSIGRFATAIVLGLAPVLAVLGEVDELVRADVERLAGVWPALEVVRIPGTDHFSALNDPCLPRAILRFLDSRPSRAR